MNHEEESELTRCVDCRAEILPGHDPSFSFGVRGTLCSECAARRGGIYDATHDHWTEEPDISDLGAEFES
jgi:hypothetical protein